MAVANPAATPWDFATAMKLGHYSWQNPDSRFEFLTIAYIEPRNGQYDDTIINTPIFHVLKNTFPSVAQKLKFSIL